MQSIFAAHINLTQQCNLRCPYCFVSHNDSTMTPETARKAIDWLRSRHRIRVRRQTDLYARTHRSGKVPRKTKKALYSPTPGPGSRKRIRRFEVWEEQRLRAIVREVPFKVDFFGGEPTYNWPALVAAVEHAEAIYPGEFHFSIVSNCTLLTEERIRWLAEHHIGILASYDGKYTQRVRTPATVELVEDTIRKLVAAGVPHVGGAMTLVPGHTSHLFENFMSHGDLGIRSVGVNHVVMGFERRYDEEDWRNIYDQYGLIVDYLADNWTNPDRMRCNLFERHLKGIMLKSFDKWHQQTGQPIPKGWANPPDWACGACKGSLAIWPNGEIMPCHEMSPELFSHWKLGNVTTGEFDETIPPLFREEKYRECDQCGVTNCGHCRPKAYHATGSETAFVPDTCRYQRILYERAVQLYNRLIASGIPIQNI